MKISYAITIHNEIEEIKHLLPLLLENIREEDEIVIQQDNTNLDEVVYTYLKSQIEGTNVKYVQHSLNGDFSQFKNNLTDNCTGDYIFQIDADEYPNDYLLATLPQILEFNPSNEVYFVPRVNTVEGLTQAHIQKWGWRVNEKGWVNFPDHQMRIWKNKPEIRWVNKVHEVLKGYKSYAALPSDEEMSLYHPKEIDRQEKQNEFYEKL
jgi:glycosyltransferase involved in cell wall biosynthesis